MKSSKTRLLAILLTLCCHTYSIKNRNVQIPIYPSMLTPSDDYSALPNNYHASIQYGENGNKNQVISRHFHHNGYQNYQHAEEASENQSKKNSIGISDVIHSMGAVFHIIQSFPKLSKSFNQKFSFDETNPFLSTKVKTNYEVKDVDDYGSSNIDIDETLNITTTSNPAENDLTTTFLPSVEIISDNEDEIKTTVPAVLFPDPNPMTTQQTILTTSTIPKSTSSSRPTVTTTLLPHDQSSAFPTTYNVPIGGDAEPWITLSQVDRHQCTYSDQVSFPCAGPDAKASFYKPTSVHRLRPGDIQIVAALGDALVSAQGALSTDITTAGKQYRGVSFATGGDEDWRTVLTIPNILREFNQRLIGTSSAVGATKNGIPGFNVATNFAFSKDLKSQAQELISRIKRNANADIREDWKLVTVLIGQNDLCKLSCIHDGTLAQFDGGNNRPQTPEEFANNVKKGLDTLMKGLPKTLVALMLPPDPTLIMEAFHRPLVCHLSSKVICPCVDGPNNIGRNHMLKVLDEYHQALIDLVEKEGYDKYNDFAVVIQPGLKDLKVPKNYVNFFGVHKSFLPDLSYLSSDCFHPSQKLQALYAKNLWNNLLEPKGAKSFWKRYSSLQCPTSERPFFSTKNNSDDFDQYYDEDSSESEEQPFQRKIELEERPFQRKRLVRRRRKKLAKRSAFFDVITDDTSGPNSASCDLL